MTGHERTLVTSSWYDYLWVVAALCSNLSQSRHQDSILMRCGHNFTRLDQLSIPCSNGSRVKRRERKGSVLACGAARRYLF